MVGADRKPVMMRRVAGPVVVALALGLGGCSVFGGGSAPSQQNGAAAGQAAAPPTTPSGQVLPTNAQQGWVQGVFGAPLAVPEDPNAPKKVPGATLVSCPDVDIRDGTETLRTFRAGAGDAASALVWQATLGKMARECRTLGASENFAGLYSVGATGRILLGPAGTPGTYQVPVRIALLRGKDVIDTRLTQVTAVIPPDESQATFSVVIDNFRVTRDPTDNLSDLQIFVGFDPAPPPAPEKPARKSRARS